VVAFLVARGFHPSGDVSTVVAFGIGIGSFAAVGALLGSRVPGNPIGLLLLAAGTLLSAAMIINVYADIGALQVPPWPGAGPARVIGPTLFIYPFLIALIGVPLVFPDGHLPSRRFRWVVWIVLADAIVLSLAALARGLGDRSVNVDVLDAAALEGILGVLDVLFVGATVIGFSAGVLAIWLRFRRGDAAQRQQVKWLVAVVALGAVILPVSLIVPGDTNPEIANAFTTLTVLTLFALPVVIAVAVLRYRLFEIDRIISRTIAWAAVTGVLVAVFAGVVIALQAALARVTQGETLAVAGSTLIAAALFQPVRRRIQEAVDRRFDRTRHDAQRAVDAFGEHLRNEIDLARLGGAVLATADDAVRPAVAGLWLREPGR
jgi:hypothetical protein